MTWIAAICVSLIGTVIGAMAVVLFEPYILFSWREERRKKAKLKRAIIQAAQRNFDLLARASTEEMPIGKFTHEELFTMRELEKGGFLFAAVATGTEGIPITGDIMGITHAGREAVAKWERERSFSERWWKFVLILTSFTVFIVQIATFVFEVLLPRITL